jgi:hypothetical protein
VVERDAYLGSPILADGDEFISAGYSLDRSTDGGRTWTRVLPSR